MSKYPRHLALLISVFFNGQLLAQSNDAAAIRDQAILESIRSSDPRDSRYQLEKIQKKFHHRTSGRISNEAFFSNSFGMENFEQMTHIFQHESVRLMDTISMLKLADSHQGLSERTNVFVKFLEFFASDYKDFLTAQKNRRGQASEKGKAFFSKDLEYHRHLRKRDFTGSGLFRYTVREIYKSALVLKDKLNSPEIENRDLKKLHSILDRFQKDWSQEFSDFLGDLDGKSFGIGSLNAVTDYPEVIRERAHWHNQATALLSGPWNEENYRAYLSAIETFYVSDQVQPVTERVIEYINDNPNWLTDEHSLQETIPTIIRDHVNGQVLMGIFCIGDKLRKAEDYSEQTSRFLYPDRIGIVSDRLIDNGQDENGEDQLRQFSRALRNRLSIELNLDNPDDPRLSFVDAAETDLRRMILARNAVVKGHQKQDR